MEETVITDLEAVKRLSKDINNASLTLSIDEARFLVDAYYQMQHNRITTDNQQRSIVQAQTEEKEPHSVLAWLSAQNSTLENQIKRSLDKWTDGHPVGAWLKEITGIGPVLAAGLLAHIDIEEAPTASHIWRFAGLDPTTTWIGKEKATELVKECLSASDNDLDEALIKACKVVNLRPERIRTLASTDAKGEPVKFTKLTLAKALAKRPFNATLKTLCWKVGESFVKVSGYESDIYGKLYLQRKELESRKNEAGEYAAIAADILIKKRIGEKTDAYKSYSVGKLPPAHIHARAKRWAVKIFLSHLQQFWYEEHYGKPAPKPFAIAILGHAHMIEPHRSR